MYKWRGFPGQPTRNVHYQDLESQWRAYPKSQSRSILELQERKVVHALALSMNLLRGVKDTGLESTTELIDLIMRNW